MITTTKVQKQGQETKQNETSMVLSSYIQKEKQIRNKERVSLDLLFYILQQNLENPSLTKQASHQASKKENHPRLYFSS